VKSMSQRSSKQFALIIFVLTLLMTTISVLGAQGTEPLPLPSNPTNQTQNAKPLFIATDASRQAVPAPAYLGVIRSRVVTIDPTALNVTDANIATRYSGGAVGLNLFDDLAFTAVNTSLQPRLNMAGYIWNGKLANDPYSSVVLVSDGQQIAGEINTSEGSYLIRSTETGATQIIEIAPGEMTEPTGTDAIPMPKTNGTGSPTSQTSVNSNALLPLRGTGNTIDIMVVYTPSAASKLGGNNATQNVIASLVAYANQAYADSGVNHRLQLVHTEQVNYGEQGIVNDLYAISKKDDRFLDEVHGLRDMYQADLVTLLSSNGSCGIGFLLGEMQPYTADFGFNVVDVQCSTGRTLAHEVGHNLGAQHDVHNTESGGITPYAYGYQDPNGQFATIMAYSTNGDCQRACPRIPYFANPALSFNGKPLGNAQSNIAQVFNETAPFVAGYRSGTPLQAGFHLLTPMHQTSLPVREAQFTWQPQANATQYMLKIRSDDGTYKFKVKVDAAQVCNNLLCSYSPAADAKWTPKANTTHSWFVKASINGLKIRSDEKWSFSNNFLPESINVSSPTSGQTLVSEAMNFTWQADERLTDYALQVTDAGGKVIAKQKFTAQQYCTYATCAVMVSLDPSAANGGYQWKLTGQRAGVLGKVKAKSNVQLQR
jgi:hypothetical protein